MRKNNLWPVLILLLIGSLGIAAVMMVLLPEKTTYNIVPSREILEMNYFHDLSGAKELGNAPNMSEILSEYALVTVDPAAFMNDADTVHEVIFGIKGNFYRKDALYRIHLVSVPSPVSPDAVWIVKNESGEFRQTRPLIKQYTGSVIGSQTGDASFTVSDDVLLGRISVGATTYYLEQRGPGRADGGKIIHILYRSDREIQRATPRVDKTPAPEFFSLQNQDQNRSHVVHVLVYNATHNPAGEETFELAPGERYIPDILTAPGDGRYFLRFTTDGNITSEMTMSLPSALRFLLNPDGTVTMEEEIFIE